MPKIAKVKLGYATRILPKEPLSICVRLTGNTKRLVKVHASCETLVPSVRRSNVAKFLRNRISKTEVSKTVLRKEGCRRPRASSILKIEGLVLARHRHLRGKHDSPALPVSPLDEILRAVHRFQRPTTCSGRRAPRCRTRRRSGPRRLIRVLHVLVLILARSRRRRWRRRPVALWLHRP